MRSLNILTSSWSASVTRVLLCATLVFTMSGCQHCTQLCSGSAPDVIAVSPAAAEKFIKTELYFGLSKPGGAVSEAEWSRFVDEHITPAFSDGLTVLDAKGQWKNPAGQIVKEGTKLVILIHKPSPENDAAIDAVIAAYKKLFQQESVLRVSTPASVSF